MNRNTPETARNPESPHPLKLFRRRGWDVAGFALALFALPGGIYGVFGVHALLGGDGIRAPVLAAAAVVAAICLHFIVGAYRAATWDGPALVLDERGLTDVWGKKKPVPWTTIERFSLDYGDGDRLVLRLRGRSSGSTARQIGTLLGRAFNGGDLVIDLNPIRCDRVVLKRTLEQYLAKAR